MTRVEKDFTEKQLHIIDSKKDVDALTRYGILLSAADLTPEVREFLKRGVYAKRVELTRGVPFVVNGDLEDVFS